MCYRGVRGDHCRPVARARAAARVDESNRDTASRADDGETLSDISRMCIYLTHPSLSKQFHYPLSLPLLPLHTKFTSRPGSALPKKFGSPLQVQSRLLDLPTANQRVETRVQDAFLWSGGSLRAQFSPQRRALFATSERAA